LGIEFLLPIGFVRQRLFVYVDLSLCGGEFAIALHHILHRVAARRYQIGLLRQQAQNVVSLLDLSPRRIAFGAKTSNFDVSIG
jgi:hypothetical protein